MRYNVHRGTTTGFTPSAANRIAQPTGTTYADLGLAPGTYFYKVTAEDAAGNVGPVSNTASAAVTDTVAPSAPSGLTANGGSGSAALSWTAATDNVGVVRYNVHRATAAGFTPSAGNRIAQPTGTTYTDVVAAGTYFYKVTAEDAAGNVGPASNEASATVVIAPPTGLVAAYGFDAGAGTTAVDQSGNGNLGTLSNATWSTTGKFGNALSFNGTNASVSIPDSNSLDLSTGMTIEGWVQPATGGGFRTLIVKERPGDLVYGLYSNSDTNRPQSQVTIGTTAHLLDGTAAAPSGIWTHLAATYDGTTQRLYANGTQVATLAVAGSILTSTSPVKIGGNSIWGEWFSGLIDEVRIYNRALSATEIQTDMNSSISSPDAVPPSAPGTLSATGGLGQINLSWGTATDNVGVTKYDVYRGTSAGFTANVAKPHRAADRHHVLGQRPGGGHLLLQGRRRGRRGQHRPGRQRGKRRSRGATRRRRPSRSRPRPAAPRSPARSTSTRTPPTTEPSRACSSSSTARTSEPRTRRRRTRSRGTPSAA